MSSSCASSTSLFLRRIVPYQRLASREIVPDSTEWRGAMCGLYRNLLLLHQRCLKEPIQKEFGDKFLRTEFKRAKGLTPKHSLTFYSSWVDYGAQLESQAEALSKLSQKRRQQQQQQQQEQKDALAAEAAAAASQSNATLGKSLTEEQLNKLSEEQKGNLHQFRSKLMEAKSDEGDFQDVPGGIR